MNPHLARSSAAGSILAASLVTSSCLTPPAATGGAERSASVTAARAPRAFTHTSKELLAGLRLGWNLGNSLDVPTGETSWGNPAVTPELLRAVAKAGFGLVRIPVTWSPHTGPGPDFVIEAGWLERVDEVVGYAHSAGLHVVINLHHYGADNFTGVEWLTLNDAGGTTTPQNDAAVQARFVRIWTQIASHFSGYREELLFESMNEIHDGYSPPQSTPPHVHQRAEPRVRGPGSRQRRQ